MTTHRLIAGLIALGLLAIVGYVVPFLVVPHLSLAAVLINLPLGIYLGGLGAIVILDKRETLDTCDRALEAQHLLRHVQHLDDLEGTIDGAPIVQWPRR